MNDDVTIAEDPFILKEVYNRYCRQIDKEDNLIDQRLNWMIASQSLLFGAFGISEHQIARVMHLIIPLVGIGVSTLVGVSIKAAILSLRKYREGLKKACPQEYDKNQYYPQLHRDSKNLDRGLAPKALPWVFLGAWIFILLWTNADYLLDVVSTAIHIGHTEAG